MHNLVIHKWIKVTSYMTHSGYTKLYQGAHNLLQIMQKCINLFYICLFFLISQWELMPISLKLKLLVLLNKSAAIPNVFFKRLIFNSGSQMREVKVRDHCHLWCHWYWLIDKGHFRSLQASQMCRYWTQSKIVFL